MAISQSQFTITNINDGTPGAYIKEKINQYFLSTSVDKLEPTISTLVTFDNGTNITIGQWIDISEGDTLPIAKGLVNKELKVYIIFRREKYTWSDGRPDTYSVASHHESDQRIVEWCSASDKTFFDGSKIYAGSVHAAQIAADAITAEKLSTDAITSRNYYEKNDKGEYIKDENGQLIETGQGSKLNLTDGTWHSKNFEIDEEGKITATSGSFTGHVEATSGSFANKGNLNLVTKDNIAQSQVTVIDKYPLYEVSKSANYGGTIVSLNHLTIGATYTLSYKFKKTSGTLKSIGGHLAALTNVKCFVDGRDISAFYGTDYGAEFIDDTNEHTVVLTFTVGENALTYIQPNRGYYDVIHYKLWAIKVEEGTEATGSYSWEFTPDKGMYMWDGFSGDPVFKVDANGLEVKGKITAESGSIAGWDINNDNSVYGPSITYGNQFGIDGSFHMYTEPKSGVLTGLNGKMNINRDDWLLGIGHSFGVTAGGALYAYRGNIAGIDISEDNLTWTKNGSLVSLLSGTLTQGTARSVGGSGEKSDWFLWTDSKFGVDAKGYLYATGADISGKIAAESGSIAGWDITNAMLLGPKEEGKGDASRKVGITSLTTAPGYAFWAGLQTGDGKNHAYGYDAPFRVDHVGNLTTNSGSIAGWTISTDSLTKGDFGQNDSIHLYVKGKSQNNVFGEENNKIWMLGIGSAFGVTDDGTVYANKGKLGEIDVSNIAAKEGKNTDDGGNGFGWQLSTDGFYLNKYSNNNPEQVFYVNENEAKVGGFNITKNNLSTGSGSGYISLQTSGDNYEYTPAEYIESNGNQYIDTGVKPTPNTITEIVFTPTGGLEENAIFGSKWDTAGYFLMLYKGILRWHSQGKVYDTITVSAGDRLVCKCSINGIEVNGVTYNTPTNDYGYSLDAANNIQLLGKMDSTGYKEGVGRIESCRIYESGKIIRNFTPAFKEGEYGLYDLCFGQFYKNKNTNYRFNGQLNIEQAEVISLGGSKYTRLEYIQNNGSNNYIEIPSLDITKKNGFIVEVEFEPTQNTTSSPDNRCCLFSNYSSSNGTSTGSNVSLELHQNNLARGYIDNGDRLGSGIAGTLANQRNKVVYTVVQEGSQHSISCSVNGQTATKANFSPSDSDDTWRGPFRIFVDGYNGGRFEVFKIPFKLYSIKVYSNGKKLFHGLPVLNSSNVPGLVDLSSGQFFTTPSGSAFTHGEYELRSGKVILGAGEDSGNSYRTLEYIESSGTQYINTGVEGNTSNLTIMAKYNILAYTQYAGIFGNYVDESYNCWRTILTEANDDECFISVNTLAGGGSTRLKMPKNTILEVLLDKDKIVINNQTTSITNKVTGTSNDSKIAVFSQKVGTTGATMRLYSFKILNEGALVRDYVPVIKNEIEYGLYDLVEQKFYNNEGTGTFTGKDYVSEYHAIYLGSVDPEIAPFSITNTGTLYCSNIQATGGSIGGWEITENGIEKKDEKGTPMVGVVSGNTIWGALTRGDVAMNTIQGQFEPLIGTQEIYLIQDGNEYSQIIDFEYILSGGVQTNYCHAYVENGKIKIKYMFVGTSTSTPSLSYTIKAEYYTYKSAIRFHAGPQALEKINQKEIITFPTYNGVWKKTVLLTEQQRQDQFFIETVKCLTTTEPHSTEQIIQVTVKTGDVYYGAYWPIVEGKSAEISFTHEPIDDKVELKLAEGTHPALQLTYNGDGKISIGGGLGTPGDDSFKNVEVVLKIRCIYTYNEELNVTTSITDNALGFTCELKPDNLKEPYSIEVEYTITPRSKYDYNFKILEDGSLYAAAARIQGHIDATSGSFSGEVYANRGRFGMLEIFNSTIATTSSNLMFTSEGTIIADKLQLNQQLYTTELKAGKISGRNTGSPYFLLEGNTTDTDTVEIQVTTTVINQGERNFWGIQDAGEVRVTVTSSHPLVYGKEFVVTVHYVDGEYGHKVDRKTIEIAQNSSSGSTTFINLMDWSESWGHARVSFEASVDTAATTVTPTSFTQPSTSTVSSIISSSSITPLGSELKLGSISDPWKQIFVAEAYITKGWISDTYSSSGTQITSDINKKNTIQNIDEKYSKLFDYMRPVTFKLNEDTTSRLHIGFIAQELKNSMSKCKITDQEFAAYCTWEDFNGKDTCGIRYTEIIPLNTWQIQKLKPRMASAEEKLLAYESRISALEKEIENLKKS